MVSSCTRGRISWNFVSNREFFRSNKVDASCVLCTRSRCKGFLFLLEPKEMLPLLRKPERGLDFLQIIFVLIVLHLVYSHSLFVQKSKGSVFFFLSRQCQLPSTTRRNLSHPRQILGEKGRGCVCERERIGRGGCSSEALISPCATWWYGNLFPSPGFQTELKEILQKSRDPVSGRSLWLACSQYLSAHFCLTVL